MLWILVSWRIFTTLLFQLLIIFLHLHKHNKLSVLDFRKCNLDGIFCQIQSLSLPVANDLLDINGVFNSFCLGLTAMIEHYTPVKMITKGTFP